MEGRQPMRFDRGIVLIGLCFVLAAALILWSCLG